MDQQHYNEYMKAIDPEFEPSDDSESDDNGQERQSVSEEGYEDAPAEGSNSNE